jgi:hypothetical protein
VASLPRKGAPVPLGRPQSGAGLYGEEDNFLFTIATLDIIHRPAFY